MNEYSGMDAVQSMRGGGLTIASLPLGLKGRIWNRTAGLQDEECVFQRLQKEGRI